MIRVIDQKIIGQTRNWQPMVKQRLVEARMTVGKSPREEAEMLVSLIATIGLHIMEPDRFRYQTFSKELLPAMHAAREVLGMDYDDRFEGMVGKLP